MTAFTNLLARLMVTPYLDGGGTWDGLDCWGLVEVWHLHGFGIRINDRGTITPGPAGIQTGFDAHRWVEINEPVDHAVAIMRSVVSLGGRRQSVQHGHCGVVWRGRIIHTERGVGTCVQSVDSLRGRVSCWLMHPEVLQA